VPTNLTQAHRQLFSRPEDERFATLGNLWDFCHRQKTASTDRWTPPAALTPETDGSQVRLALGTDGAFALNHWSFSQLCTMCGVSRDTINRLSPETARRAIAETLPGGTKPLQILTTGDTVRSIHGVTYSRLWSADLVAMLREFAVDFQPPPQGFNGATGLYAGEQDLFAFLIDPAGWAEIDGEAFAPGFFVWNSEVGKATVGISTFWFQAVCQNHIVWDATEIVEFTRKHTGKVHESLGEIRRIVETLVEKRDARRDGFATLMRKAMVTTLGSDAEEVEKLLGKSGFSRQLAARAVAIAQEQKSRFTVFSVVDALTRMARELTNAGDRTDADQKASRLLALAA
jgi:hypothetical protein